MHDVQKGAGSGFWRLLGGSTAGSPEVMQGNRWRPGHTTSQLRSPSSLLCLPRDRPRSVCSPASSPALQARSAAGGRAGPRLRQMIIRLRSRCLRLPAPAAAAAAAAACCLPHSRPLSAAAPQGWAGAHRGGRRRHAGRPKGGDPGEAGRTAGRPAAVQEPGPGACASLPLLTPLPGLPACRAVHLPAGLGHGA